MEGPRLNGTGYAQTSALSGIITDIHLRIVGHHDRFTFLYSPDGTAWDTLATYTCTGKVLMQAGLFCKRWWGGDMTAEFDSLRYEAAPIPKGTLISIF